MPGPTPSNNDNIQSEGRKENAAQDLNAARDNAGAERYPPVDKDDSVTRPGQRKDPTGERRTFEGNPQPRQGAGDPDPSVNEGRLGPGGDPAEGKR